MGKYWYDMTKEEFSASWDRMNIREEQTGPWKAPALLPEGVGNGVDFQRKGRPELLRLFEENFYGRIPPRCEHLSFVTETNDSHALGGIATRREISIVCRQRGFERVLHMLLYIPNAREGRVPVFFGLNFKGNAACTTDPDAAFLKPALFPETGISRHEDCRVVSEKDRGLQAHRWDFEKVIRRGYASATINYYDICPDRPDLFERSIFPMFMTEAQWKSPERNTGAISAWAWGVERAIDCLEAQPEIDPRRIAVHGHSRLGKTALWAGANDQRIALTVSNCSGTLGAKLHHRNFGENFEWIAVWNMHWVTPRFAEYYGRDAECPIDQHQLMSLVAPRLLYVASASRDNYADPRGEFASAVLAGEAYRLFGAKGLPSDQFPETGRLLSGDIAYYLREGEHDFTPENWDALLEYTDSKWN